MVLDPLEVRLVAQEQGMYEIPTPTHHLSFMMTCSSSLSLCVEVSCNTGTVTVITQVAPPHRPSPLLRYSITLETFRQLLQDLRAYWLGWCRETQQLVGRLSASQVGQADGLEQEIDRTSMKTKAMLCELYALKCERMRAQEESGRKEHRDEVTATDGWLQWCRSEHELLGHDHAALGCRIESIERTRGVGPAAQRRVQQSTSGCPSFSNIRQSGSIGEYQPFQTGKQLQRVHHQLKHADTRHQHHLDASFQDPQMQQTGVTEPCDRTEQVRRALATTRVYTGLWSLTLEKLNRCMRENPFLLTPSQPLSIQESSSVHDLELEATDQKNRVERSLSEASKKNSGPCFSSVDETKKGSTSDKPGNERLCSAEVIQGLVRGHADRASIASLQRHADTQALWGCISEMQSLVHARAKITGHDKYYNANECSIYNRYQ